MIQLLFTLLAAEAALVLVLLFRTPARRLALLAVDCSKRGRGPLMARTVAATMFVVLGSSGYSIAKIRRREGEFAQLTPTDQVLASRHLLEASLMASASAVEDTAHAYDVGTVRLAQLPRRRRCTTAPLCHRSAPWTARGVRRCYIAIDVAVAVTHGYSLFLGLIIDRLHHYIRQLRAMKKNMEAVTKQSRVLEETKLGDSEEIQGYQKKIDSLNEQVQVLKHQSESQTQELKTAEMNNLALQKQSEGLLTEYERLIAENEELRNKLQTMDLRFSRSDSKKNT
ncbi:hypothetical protein TRIUR3_06470 [Triticum urartu]|uniref:Endoplasmic reticulum transmembrane protein n=2 Tax=Triticum TaxID=4564 RepID=A0A9R0Q981_TRITD|nr:hypothetical protein TRIUR3_06470 [Triticum urartu]VAH07232.1 unnamed protein product [Triticum turgidum subsp. durum]